MGKVLKYPIAKYIAEDGEEHTMFASELSKTNRKQEYYLELVESNGAKLRLSLLGVVCNKQSNYFRMPPKLENSIRDRALKCDGAKLRNLIIHAATEELFTSGRQKTLMIPKLYAKAARITMLLWESVPVVINSARREVRETEENKLLIYDLVLNCRLPGVERDIDIIVEIYNTHETGESKEEQLKTRDKHAIRLDVSHVNIENKLDILGLLEEQLNSDQLGISWISHPDKIYVEQSLNSLNLFKLSKGLYDNEEFIVRLGKNLEVCRHNMARPLRAKAYKVKSVCMECGKYLYHYYDESLEDGTDGNGKAYHGRLVCFNSDESYVEFLYNLERIKEYRERIRRSQED